MAAKRGPAPSPASSRSRPTCPARARSRRGPASSSPPTRRRSGRSRGDRRLQGRGRLAGALSGRSARALRNAIAKQYGLNPDRIVCGCGSDELINLLAHAYLGPGDEAVYSEHGFLDVQDRHAGERRARRCRVPEKAYTRRRRRDPGARHARGPRSCSSPTPTTRPAPISPHDEVRRLHKGLPANVLLVLDAAYCRVRAPQRLRGGPGAGRHHRQHGDDAHLLQDLRAGRAAARLGLLPGCGRRRARTACAARSTSRRRRSPPAWRRWPTARTSRPPSRTTRSGCPG